MAWSEQLGCYWDVWTAMEEGVLQLMVPLRNKPNMQGTVRTAQMLNPTVHRVEVVNISAEVVAIYERRGNGTWSLLRSMR